MTHIVRRSMPPPPLTPEQLFERFDALGIVYLTYSHPPVFTVAEATALRGARCGSLAANASLAKQPPQAKMRGAAGRPTAAEAGVAQG